jgi:TonB family protein
MTTGITSTKKKLSVADTLREAQHFAEANQLEESLAVIKGVKALDPRNVYILAFEKQVEQLLGMSGTGALTQEQRADILESIPGIVDRAVEGASVSTADAPTVAAPGSPAASRDDKAAALEWLKDQYFQHAHEYVQKGEHEHALAEIRRVYIIDPGNSTAIDFERRVMQLAGIASPGSTVPPSQRQLRLVTRETLANEPPPPEEAEPILMKTEEWSSPTLEEPTPEPQPKHRAEPRPEQQPSQPQTHPLPAPRRGLRPVTTGVLMLAVLAVGATIYMLWTHQETTKRSEQRRSSIVAVPQQEVFIGAPTAEEQNYVVSSPSKDSNTGTPEVSEETSSPIPKEAAASQRTERRQARETAKPTQSSSHKATEKQKPAPVKEQPVRTGAETSSKETLPAGIAAASVQQAPPEQSAPATPVIEKDAQIIKLERPRFSEAAYAAGINGQVIVQVQINAQGKPLQTKVLNTNNQLLVTPVIEAVMKSQFAPAQMTSGPVTSWMTIPFKFTSK